MNEYTNNIDLPNAKLATWLELCISDENYQIIVNLSCNKCLFSHDLSLDLYGHPYKVLIDYNALTSPFAHIGEEIHGDVVVVNNTDEPNTIVFWFDVITDDKNRDKSKFFSHNR